MARAHAQFRDLIAPAGFETTGTSVVVDGQHIRTLEPLVSTSARARIEDEDEEPLQAPAPAPNGHVRTPVKSG